MWLRCVARGTRVAIALAMRTAISSALFAALLSLAACETTPTEADGTTEGELRRRAFSVSNTASDKTTVAPGDVLVLTTTFTPQRRFVADVVLSHTLGFGPDVVTRETMTANALQRGQEVVVKQTLRVPLGAPEGAYRIGTSATSVDGSLSYHSNEEALSITVSKSAAPAATSGISAASVSPANVAAGGTVTAKASIALPGGGENLHVLMQLVDEAYNVVDKYVVSSQAFVSGQAAVYSHDFALPASLSAATYYLSIGVFSPDWSNAVAYLDRGASFTVASGSGAPATPPSPTGVPAPTYPPTGPLTLAFREEFDTDLRQWSDREPWQNPPGADAYGGASWFSIPAGPLSQVSGGNLTLAARACANPKGFPMCGAEVSTRGKYQSFVHGHVEARVKVDDNAHGFPGVWLLGNGTGDLAWPKTGEIDIFEFVNNGRDEGIPFFTVHWSCPQDPWGHCQKSYEWPARLTNFAAGFHVWSFTRTADWLESKIDGVVSSRITRADLAAIGGNYDVIFNEPMHLRVDLASGGPWAGDANRAPAPGDLVVDYIRVWSAP